ncbi:K02A2.6-like [Cordylochernes scorpioides]|uniref:RNA-directed DNA polymerase n=1 Tax=Cordylochernes scorpioides TaxID=51811 RepID=A0ABY6LBM6_9ARAC|nr:K02A2.6-like [Cordylochernes scorpioides]
MPENQFKKLNTKNKVQPTNIVFRSYTGNVFNSLGKVEVQVEFKDRTSIEELFIIPNNYDPLLGRTWIRHLKINLEEIDQENLNQIKELKVSSINDDYDIEKEFPEIYTQKVGCVPDFLITLQLRQGAKPSFTPERNVPYALREKVEKELDTLEAEGIISKAATSDWGSPLVVIPKGDGTVRLCVDYKVGVNDQLVNASYPIKRIEDVLNSLKDSKYFCRLDLYKAYLHLRTDEESSIIQTISTHRGTYRMNRLSFGIKTAPAKFNRVIDQILQGLNKTISYFDDILVHGKSKQECKENLFACLERLRAYDLHLNKNKCIYFQTKIEYLGHVIENNKLSKSPSKVKAIIDMPQPKNIADLRRFLGMITYYSRFLPDVSTITYPLRRLLKKDKNFFWSAQCKAAFIKLKNEVASDRVLIPFDTNLPVTLTTDASPVGIAAVLSHGFDYVVSFKKGTENQIADCLSRAPTAQGYVTTDMIINEEVHRICSSTVFEISRKTLTVEEIVKETDKDKELSKLKRDIKSNSIESDYTINGEILFKNDKVVVPKSLQLEVLKDLHSTHLGIVKMKQLARRYCTWKNIDKDIENLVKSCKDCLSTQNNPPKAPVHHWDPPSTNWERIHLDYAGPFQGYYYLVLIDAKSRWAEIKAISEPPTSLNTIKLLNDIFSTHGYPFVMVSDNALYLPVIPSRTTVLKTGSDKNS